MTDQEAVKGLINIRLFTKQQNYAVADIPYSVPITVDTDTLNNLVNELLKENEDIKQQVQFDFIVDEKLLRSSLSEHLEEYNISTELTINIEYIVKNPPPEPKDCLLHDDWVSAVDICNNWILTGCYDNTIHLWSTKGKHKLVIPGHTSPVKAVAWVQLDDEQGIFVSGSHDQTAILWNWNVKENSVHCVTVLRGHERGLECVKVNLTGSLMVSSGWDTLIKLWSTKLEDSENISEDEPSSKRLCTESGKARTPIMTLQGHKEAVCGISWINKETVSTASWDHTIRLWDIELGGIKKEIVGNKAFLDIDYSQINNLIVAASADRYVRIYDIRSNEGSIVKGTYMSHTQWIQTVKWSENDEHLFISGGHDTQVKMWDVRSHKAPLFDFTGHEDKVLCCDWKNKLIVSGSSDNTVRILKETNNKIY